MNFARLIIGLFGIQVIATTAEAENPKIVIPPSEIIKIIGLTNKLRRSVNPPPTNLINDITMMAQLGAEADVQSDLNAIINYSLKQSPPSIAGTISDNLMQYRTSLVWGPFKQAEFFEDFITRDLAIPFMIAPSIKPT